MKKLILYLFVLSLLLTFCSKDNPTSPEEEIPGELLATTTIGPEGGSLQTEGFKLTVPEGAFTGAADLKLYSEPAAEHLIEIAVSELFSVEGIPEDFQKPLNISLKYSGELSGINFIAVGKKDTVQLIDSSFVDVIYDLYEAEESDGFLSCEIEIDQFNINGLAKKDFDDPDPLNIIALTKGKNEPAGEHFTIKGSYPVANEAKVNTIVEYFEQAYIRFKDAGFDYSGIDKRIELEFFIDYYEDYESVVVINTSPSPKIKICINTSEVTNSLRSNIEGTFLELALRSRGLPRDYTLPYTYWARFRFGANKYKKRNDVKVLFRGTLDWGNPWSQSYLIEYISDNYGGENKIAQISRKAINSFKTVGLRTNVLAIIEVMGNPKENDWLNKFYEYLITDDRYDEYTSSFYINDIGAKSDVIDNNTTNVIHTLDYDNQGPKLFHLSLISTFNENTKLKFSTDITTSGISIIKYKSGEKREVIKSGYGAVTITGIKQLAEDGFNLFALVTNNEYDPPHGKTNITLTVKKSEELIFTGCSIFLGYLKADLDYEFPIGTHNTLTDEDLSMAFPKDDPDAEVTFSNNTLTQKYNFQFTDGYYYAGDITIKFGEDTDGNIDMNYISSVTAKWKTAQDINYTVTVNKNELSAINIPKDETVTYLRYRLGGTGLCAKLENLYKKIIRGTWIKTLIAGTWKCDYNSELNIYISTQ